MEELIYAKGLMEQLQSLIIGRSTSFSEGWIYINDLEKIVQKYKNKELNRLGKEIK